MFTKTSLRNIGAAVILIATAAPAMAYDSYTSSSQGAYTEAFRGPHPVRAQDAIRLGYGNIYPKYHSGWAGPYGDGNYPGTIDDNMGPPYHSRQ